MAKPRATQVDIYYYEIAKRGKWDKCLDHLQMIIRHLIEINGSTSVLGEAHSSIDSDKAAWGKPHPTDCRLGNGVYGRR